MSSAPWNKLLYGIEKGDCILLLGPELPVQTRESREVPAEALARRLIRALDQVGAEEFAPSPDDLPRIAQRFVAREDDVSLEMELVQWYEEWLTRPSSLHDDLAALPFRFIVSCGLDPLMEAALRRADKIPSVERYHYRGRNKELLPQPTTSAPVLFHLFGSVKEPASVVLTELQLLDFLNGLISRNPPLPNDLNAALSNGRLFLFVGFGLKQWYLRILFHVLRVLRPDSRGFAIEALDGDGDAEPGNDDQAILFYRDNFKMDLLRVDPLEFATQLRQRYVAGGGPAREVTGVPPDHPSQTTAVSTNGVTVFICHASEDADTAREVRDALKRAGLEPWLDKASLRGGDRWDAMIASTINEVDYFVVLNSRALTAKSREASYVNEEINRALEASELRLIGQFIVPVSIDDAPLLEPLRRYHAVDLRSPEGLRDLVRAVKRQVGAA